MRWPCTLLRLLLSWCFLCPAVSSVELCEGALLRRLVTDIVLCTDMAVHSQMLEQAGPRLRTSAIERELWEPDRIEARLLAMKVRPDSLSSPSRRLHIPRRGPFHVFKMTVAPTAALDDGCLLRFLEHRARLGS